MEPFLWIGVLISGFCGLGTLYLGIQHHRQFGRSVSIEGTPRVSSIVPASREPSFRYTWMEDKETEIAAVGIVPFVRDMEAVFGQKMVQVLDITGREELQRAAVLVKIKRRAELARKFAAQGKLDEALQVVEAVIKQVEERRL